MRTAYLPGDAPAAQVEFPAQLSLPLMTAAPQGSGDRPNPRTGRRKGPAWVAAYTGMSSIAERMHPNYGPALRHSDPVAYADAVTSMCDQRAALCFATGVELTHVDRNGYNTTRSASREGVQR